jgi:hypothetical protein
MKKDLTFEELEKLYLALLEDNSKLDDTNSELLEKISDLELEKLELETKLKEVQQND